MLKARVVLFLGVVHLNASRAEEIHPLGRWGAVGHNPGDQVPVHHLAQRSGGEFGVVNQQNSLTCITDCAAV